jgi:enoyl-CoA hydratase/carnithine racemase
LKTLSNDEKIKVIVICSEVKGIFCAGGDIKLLNQDKLDY